MKKERVGTPISVGETTIVPLERVRMFDYGEKWCVWVGIYKEPIGIVIASPQGTWAVDTSGTHVALATYIQNIHGLQEVLDSL